MSPPMPDGSARSGEHAREPLLVVLAEERHGAHFALHGPEEAEDPEHEQHETHDEPHDPAEDRDDGADRPRGGGHHHAENLAQVEGAELGLVVLMNEDGRD